MSPPALISTVIGKSSVLTLKSGVEEKEATKRLPLRLQVDLRRLPAGTVIAITTDPVRHRLFMPSPAYAGLAYCRSRSIVHM
jgi:hypothetical protein